MRLAARRRSGMLPAVEAAVRRGAPKSTSAPRKLASCVARTTSKAFHYFCLGGCMQGWRQPVPEASRRPIDRSADIPGGGAVVPLA
mmetsp:Transcript_24621/g.20977  ORF Transcript_24621/g.20977 Transcript_24621/m.20977 type:complete len:86 (-) Transcript_24621:13-270(-)